MTKRRSLKISEDFENAVEQYKNDNDLQSWSYSIIWLAMIGLSTEGIVVKSAPARWGGLREKGTNDAGQS